VILLFAALQAAPPPPPALPEEDIVVIARKLDRWRGRITTSPLGTRCVTKLSTGDREIDKVGCTAMERCWPTILPRMKAAQATGADKAERRAAQEAINADFGACARPQRVKLIEELRARRAAARGAGA